MQFYWDIRVCVVSEVTVVPPVGKRKAKYKDDPDPEYTWITDNKDKWVCRVKGGVMPPVGTNVVACVNYWMSRWVKNLPVFKDNPVAWIIGVYPGKLPLGTRLLPTGYTYVHRPLGDSSVKRYHRLPIHTLGYEGDTIVAANAMDPLKGVQMVPEQTQS